MQMISNSLISEGKKIVLIPTMGALHEAHLSLVKEGAKWGDVVVVSLFVNPTQFAPGEDLDAYPRDMTADIGMLADLDVDIVFTPGMDDIYPPGYETYVELEELPAHLCGLTRQGHFRGVATVVLKLFNMVKPHYAVFGMKDYQQLRVITKMVRDLAIEVKIIPHPTVREPGGLAMSSRNTYLSPAERERANALSESLTLIRDRFTDGVADTSMLITEGKGLLSKRGIEEVEYLEICDPETLDSRSVARRGDLVALALKIRGTRLIDNLIL